MFLNLKNKKIAETIANQQAKLANHPKTHRQESQQRNSREHKEIKSHRQNQHQNPLPKKQAGSTALNTIQSNNSFSNIHPHFKIKIKDINDRESLENISKSQQKIDSFRMERVASAYRKIKRIDNNDSTFLLEETEKGKKVTAKPHKAGKKEIINNLVKNYVCATESEQYEYKILDKMNSSKTDLLQELIAPFFELFSPTPPSAFKDPTNSHPELELKKSLDKNSKQLIRQNKKKSNEILIKEEEQLRSGSEEENTESFISNFFIRLDRARDKIDNMNNSKKFKYVESPSITAFQRLYDDIERFVSSFYQVCLKEFNTHFRKYQGIITEMVRDHQLIQQKYEQMERDLRVERQRSKKFENLAINYQQKSLYSTIFINQLSYGYDIDSHVRDRLYEQAKKNGLISEDSYYQFSETQLPKAHHRSGVELGTTSKNLYDNNENQFLRADLNLNKQEDKTLK